MITPRGDHAIAYVTARAAGERLLALRGLVDGAGADAASHALIVAMLERAAPGDAVRSEEGERGRGRRSRVWIVDPLDGTREFCEAGRTDWAVHVALWDSGRLTAAAVALPAAETILSTLAPSRPPPRHRRPRIVVSRSRPPQVATEVAVALGGEIVELGSAGAKTAAVVCGDADVYLHAGGQFEWDSAAPSAVASACGLHVSRLDGRPLVYNRDDPWLPDLVVCRREVADAVLGIACGTAE
ncbi:MAG TPA: inositol monophosphatase family protein [Gaiellaceae bacterium]|nr:inositol monophosphatase family protein [Gaiellaceae bacterium]